MGIVIVIVSLGAALHLALWGALYRKLSELPLSVWKIGQRNRMADETRALDLLQAMAATKLGGLVIGVQTYHDELAALTKAQTADAEVRARLNERRVSEVGATLDAASDLLRRLRGLVDDLAGALARARVTLPPEKSTAPDVDLAAEDANRATMEMYPSEETTTVADHPLRAIGAFAPARTLPVATGGAR
jgi:hypothetical protein